jgi:alkyl hydroperoxide reductase subunit D
MSLEQLKETLPDFAKDIKLNLSNLFGNIGQSGLSEAQFYGTALAIAYSLKIQSIIRAISADGTIHLSPDLDKAAKIAATLMAMNNIYYRAIHLAEDSELAAMPANLRMSGMINPGVEKIDFELFSLGISAINGCGMCINSHVKQLNQHGVSKTAIQSVLRIAATLNAVALVVSVEH